MEAESIGAEIPDASHQRLVGIFFYSSPPRFHYAAHNPGQCRCIALNKPSKPLEKARRDSIVPFGSSVCDDRNARAPLSSFSVKA